jgi:hypothetical protein
MILKILLIEDDPGARKLALTALQAGGQGHHICRPLPPTDVTSWLKETNRNPRRAGFELGYVH